MYITELNRMVGEALWGGLGLTLLLGAGVFFTLRTGFFQVRHCKLIFKKTIGSIGSPASSGDGISQFQAMCTALAACVGVGNIAGVATAVALGGPGALFWMLVASFFGMMTAYAENVLGILYRQKDRSGKPVGGPMYYLRDGFGAIKGCRQLGRLLAVLFAVFCVFSSLGMGNMSQVNTAIVNLCTEFPLPELLDVKVAQTDLYCIILGLILALVEGACIFGGTKRVASITEKVVPVMVILYTVGAIVVTAVNRERILPAVACVFRCAFGVAPAGAGVLGFGVKSAVEWGFKRGVFSNEAGLGSSVIINAATEGEEPAEQGMWAILEVFIDTVVMCSLTALVILTSGLVDLTDGTLRTDMRATTLVAEAFSGVFGSAGGAFIAISVLLFAFSTVLGWSCYGCTAWEYLFGKKSAVIYKCIYVVAIFFGATLSLELVWELSDTFNALMMVPNLIGVAALSGRVVRYTRRYLLKFN